VEAVACHPEVLTELLCASQVVLFDVQQRSTLGELSTPFVKYAVWSADMSAVALLSKHAIIIANKRLGSACTVHETIRVKVPLSSRPVHAEIPIGS